MGPIVRGAAWAVGENYDLSALGQARRSHRPPTKKQGPRSPLDRGAWANTIYSAVAFILLEPRGNAPEARGPVGARETDPVLGFQPGLVQTTSMGNVWPSSMLRVAFAIRTAMSSPPTTCGPRIGGPSTSVLASIVL